MFPFASHALRRGLHSLAATRLVLVCPGAPMRG